MKTALKAHVSKDKAYSGKEKEINPSKHTLAKE